MRRMDDAKLLKIVDALRDEAERCNHRRLIVIAGDRIWTLDKLKKVIQHLPYKKRIVFTWQKDFEINAEIEELKNSEKYLGTTYELLAIDLHHSFVPNDLGKLVNIVKGGGLIFLLTPTFEEWKRSTNFFHEVILTPPYTMDDIKRNFVRWVTKKLLENEGITIIEGENLLKLGTMECGEDRREIKIPQKFKFKRELYDMAKTQDQVRVLNLAEHLEKKGVMVITADRGRGKSSVLGMIAGAYSGKLRKIGVTAPDINNLQEFFKFLEHTLHLYHKHYTKGQRWIKGKNFKIEFEEASKLNPRKYDLLIVDEAAGIPVPLLLNFLKARRVIYSTTTHGYEGTGRSFSIRFLGELKKRDKNFMAIEMNEPIRYAKDDPVERWLFDTLLLDAEPCTLDDIKIQELEYKKYDIGNLLDDERKLREYYGIFVLAHYRNNPNDFGILCDAPNHEIRTLEKDGHVVCSVQLAREGNLKDYEEELYFGVVPPGNIVPDVIIKHYRKRDFSKFVGYRIVRIATHPDFMDRGIGSKMLEKIKEEDVDWIGSSFGATAQLLNFWIKNDFYPIHISPKLNESTGEYSVVVLHPKNSEIKRDFNEIRKRFGKKLIYSLGEIHRNLDLDIARLLLLNLPRDEELELDEVEWKRLIAYCWGPGNYEATMDVIYKVASSYFFLRRRPHLNEEQEKILIGKVLQHKHWEEIGKEIGKGGTYVVIELREIMRKFIKGVFEYEVLEFQRRFHGED